MSIREKKNHAHMHFTGKLNKQTQLTSTLVTTHACKGEKNNNNIPVTEKF